MSTTPITPIGNNTFQLSHPSGELIKVGGTYIELPRFQGECLLKPTLQIVGKPVPELQGDKIAVGNAKIQLVHKATPVNRLYNESGGIDQIITLYSKPTTNLLIFDYDSTKLIPYLQPPLTADEIKDDCARPDHVVNSIAWFHNSKGGLVHSGDATKGITTGKALHQYAMIATDSKGNKSWTAWEILNSSQIGLRIDEKFLAEAVYPAVIAPIGDTFGYTSTGASASVYTANTMRVQRSYTAPANGTLNSVSVCFCQNDSLGDYAAIRGVVYKTDNSLLTFGNEQQESSSTLPATWHTSTCTNASISSGVEYMFGVWLRSPSVGYPILAYDSGAGHALDKASQTYSPTSAPPTTWTYVNSVTGSLHSIYCTYTAGGGGANTYNISVTEGFLSQDTSSKICKILPNLAEGLKSGDGLFQTYLARPSTVEGIKLNDGLTPLKYTFPSISEGIKVQDSISYLVKLIISLSESIKSNDILSNLIQTFPGLSEGIKLQDYPSTLKTYLISILEGFKTNDTPTNIYTAHPSISESLGINDSLFNQALMQILVNEGISIQDAASFLGQIWQLSVSEGLSIQDALFLWKIIILAIGGSKLASRAVGNSSLNSHDFGGSQIKFLRNRW